MPFLLLLLYVVVAVVRGCMHECRQHLFIVARVNAVVVEIAAYFSSDATTGVREKRVVGASCGCRHSRCVQLFAGEGEVYVCMCVCVCVCVCVCFLASCAHQ